MEKEKAVIYSRVSTDKEEQQTSIKSQREYYSKYATEKGFELVGDYFDEGLSATSSNRKAFIEMLEDAGLTAIRNGNVVTFENNHDKEPLFDWIIVKDASRFARNVNVIDIVRLLREKGVYVEFEAFSFSSNSHDWEFRLGLFLLFAQEEAISTSKKLRDAYMKKSEQGRFHMSVNLLGYDRDKGTDEYYIVEDEAKIVRRIFDLYTEEERGSYEIAILLNRDGLKTTRGKDWTGSSVNRVLNNEKYKGTVILNRYSHTDLTGSHRRVINPKNEWIIYEDAIPKIVSKEQFDKAQNIMRSRSRTTRKTEGSDKRQVRGRKKIKNVFHGKMYCHLCGADYVRSTTTKIRAGKRVKEYFYMCRNRTPKRATEEKCLNKGISHDVLVRELTILANNINMSDSRLDEEKEVLDSLISKVDDKLNNNEDVLSDIDKEISDIDSKIDNLFDTLSSGVSQTIIDRTQAKIEELEADKTTLESSKLDYSVVSLERRKQSYRDKYDKIVRFSKKEEFSFDEILELVQGIIIVDDHKVNVLFSIPSLGFDDVEDTDVNKIVQYEFYR